MDYEDSETGRAKLESTRMIERVKDDAKEATQIVEIKEEQPDFQDYYEDINADFKKEDS